MATNKERHSRRGKLFYFLIFSCSVLAVVCTCLLTAIILLSHSSASACGVSVGDVSQITESQLSDIVTHSPGNMDRKKPWETSFRLPLDTIPILYDILLHPDLNNSTFTGEVIIQIHVKETRTFLLVNTKYLDIYETRLSQVIGEISDNVTTRVRGDEKQVAIKETLEYKPNEFWVVLVEEKNELQPGIYNLQLKFRGNLTGKIVGFYRSVYTIPETQEKRTIATSKFEPTYARQAYPCFDEPGFKPTFKIRLVRPRDGYIALSNMNQVAETVDSPKPGLTTVEFNESVPMVTYLSCFIVCDFERLDPVTISQGFPFSVYSTPTQVQKTKYALDVGVNITEYYIQYFGIPYPLPKLDLIAIPDFVSGAMEHWGLVTFREVNLLYEEGISSTSNKQRVAIVIGHELAHMWFGNLVTLNWWNDLWLNEGFASYIEYKGVNNAHPDWQMLDQFLVEDLHYVMDADASFTSHPIVLPVSHPDEISQLFDTISYAKGAAVIRMLEDFLGEEDFRKAVINFLKRFVFANAVTQDLWDEFQKVHTAVNITHVMNTWTRQMGYPVVTARRYSNGEVILTQQRFLSNPYDVPANDSAYSYKWDIPISYITSKSKTVKREWLHSDNKSVTLQIPNDVEWFKINCHQKGFYRVNYDEQNWIKLVDLLKKDPNALDIPDRGHLLNDLFSLAEAGHVNYTIAMDLTRYITSETEYIPWRVASSKLHYFNDLMNTLPSYANLRKYVQSLVSNIYKKVTMKVSESDTHMQRLLRPAVVDLACDVGLQECVNEATSIFKSWISNVNNTTKPHPDIRSIIYSNGIKNSRGEKEWNIMWDMYVNETDAQEKTKLMVGLAYSSEPWILHRYIQYAKNENNVRSQDFFSVLGYISKNPIGTSIVWDFVREEWEYLVERFTLNDRYLGRLIPTITKTFNTTLKLHEMEIFFKKYPNAGAGETTRSQALDQVKKNIKWLERHRSNIEKWLEQASLEL